MSNETMTATIKNYVLILAGERPNYFFSAANDEEAIKIAERYGMVYPDILKKFKEGRGGEDFTWADCDMVYSPEKMKPNYCITVCNGNCMVYEREFHAESLHEAEAAWRDEIRRGGSVYLYVRDGEKWTLIKEKERPDYN